MLDLDDQSTRTTGLERTVRILSQLAYSQKKITDV